jgi:hypothetical protein
LVSSDLFYLVLEIQKLPNINHKGAMMKTTECRSCKAQIGFILTIGKGKRMPVNPNSVMRTNPNDEENPYKTLISEQGQILKNPAVGTIGFVPHWATCNDSNRFRKPKEKKCPDCQGDGWTAGHNPNDPHENGCSGSCPVQLQCETCQGTGKIKQ